MLGCKLKDIPIEPNHKLGLLNKSKTVDRERYQQLISKLIYLSHTRFDITFAVSVVSQFMHSPGEEHFEVAYPILEYLKGKLGRDLLLENHGHSQIEAYTDAD